MPLLSGKIFDLTGFEVVLFFGENLHGVREFRRDFLIDPFDFGKIQGRDLVEVDFLTYNRLCRGSEDLSTCRSPVIKQPEGKETKTMKSRLLITALLALNISLPAVHASEEQAAGAENPAVGAATLVTLSATVAAINQDTREVTLKDADGNELAITVGEEVKNLPQVKVGDQVEVAYYESVNVELLGPEQAEPEAAAMSALETAEPGQKPAGALATELSIVATIDAINKDAETVTLTGPEGNTKTVKVRNPANLEKVAVGDKVMITLTRAIAVDVSEAPASE